ncbi:MAG: GNAT family N-acetyltransferase [Planctomycetota bacterium]|nr:GNAT family N-acetyltransferase [Planctomycetota bacterium]
MRIERLCSGNAAGVARLWRLCFPLEKLHAHGAWNPRGEAMTRKALERRVLSREVFDARGSFVLVDGERVVAFCIAAIFPGATGSGASAGGEAMAPAGAGSQPERVGHICAIAVAPAMRRRGIGSRLLALAERYLARRGADTVSVSFVGNPLPLLGGVPVNETAYPFFLNRGYRTMEGGILQVMTLDTSRFRLSRRIVGRKRENESRGISFGRMEPGMFGALESLLAREFPAWREGIMISLRRVLPPAILAAWRGREVVGYAGPYRVLAPVSTGTFHSIGVTREARGMGIGAVLFNLMCKEMKASGARRISLTTELTNPAREIYARAGFRTLFLVDYGLRKHI